LSLRRKYLFRLNRETKLKNGEFLTPYLVDKETVYCLTKSRKTVTRSVVDFDFTPQVKASVIMVAPLQEVEKPQQIPIYIPLEKQVASPPQEEIIQVKTIEPVTQKKINQVLDSLVVIKGKVINEEQSTTKKVDTGILKNEEYI
jgi:hypothetical protein